MTLDSVTSYPSSRAYVLKLHRDSGAPPARFAGRLENLATGRQFEFASAAGLLALLLSDLGTISAAEAQSAGDDR